MKRYETFVILDPDLSEENRKPVIEKINDLILQKNGLLVEKDEWGARKLAYEIKKKIRGYYILLDYCGTGSLVSEIERSCRIDDRVIKYMTIQIENEVDIDRIKKEMEEKKAQRKAAAEEAAKAAEPVTTTTVSETAEGVSEQAETTETPIDAEEQPNE
jgi:small subunit ribosomal protein S6